MSLRTLLVAALLVVAGCAAPAAPPAADSDPSASDRETMTATAPSPPDSSTSPDSPISPPSTTASATASTASPQALAEKYDVRVAGGSLPVEYGLVFARVAVATDRPAVVPPSVVRLEPTESMELGGAEYAEFYRLLGFRVSEDRERALTAAAYVATPETVVVNEAILADEARTESTLAHESVHVVQYRTDAFERLAGTAAAPSGSTAERLLQAAIVEGAATYVEGAYVRRYAPEAPSPTESLRTRTADGSPAERLGVAPYLAGARYVDARVSGPGEVGAVYDDPPRTAEELLHDRPPGSEPVAPLTVRDAPEDGWTSDADATDTYGELFVRVTLETGVEEATAADAAHGWGNDVRRRFVRADGGGEGSARTGYAWAIRFDDDANATAFAAAFETWREARPANASRVRLERPAPETVVLLLGDERFVTRATASGSDGAVSVRVNGTE
ncbi:hypothetical protein [Halobaculum rubrum]|uniref:hypothetical protein n=1 Tax=Halobaculum rubrum TaxID=2872158 RepID=UPI001CA41159|nr:hypothetical protein [Halobaculum rubrum]QZX99624.1 hypothetical protein K6T25_00505 [Halobaculum rubrum]